MAGVPTLSPKAIEALLTERLAALPSEIRYRIVRSEGHYVLVSVSHLHVPAFRAAWNGEVAGRPGISVRTVRSFGTLRKGKAILARHRGAAALGPDPRSAGITP